MNLTRRDFLQMTGLAAVGLPLSHDVSWAFPGRTPFRSGSGKRVVVLGAGLAGLVSAWELRASGHDVSILEAQLHPGGRAHTIREGLSDGLYAEAGAARIPANHDATLAWVTEFGLELEAFLPTEKARVAVLKGKRVIVPADGSVDASQLPLKLTEEERRVGLANLEEHYYGEISKQVGNIIRDDWPPEILKIGDVSMTDFLRQRGASEDAIHYMLLGFEENSVLDYVRELFNQGRRSKIKGGTDLLPRAFAGKLSDVICYGCAVEHIERKEKSARITYRRMGMMDQVEADAVVCTIPYGVLRKIAVTPEWSPAKRNAIDKLHYGAVVRTTYQTRRRFWEDEGLNGFGTSDKKFEVWCPTFNKPGRRGLLQAYNYEDYAEKLDKLGEAELRAQAIEDMAEVHPGLRPNLETVIAKSWMNDPWQRGAYTTYSAGQIRWYADICRPEGRVWFAGEHASGWPGWMQGALTSGIKAAREINASL